MTDDLTIINDTHCGVVRSGGTTPRSSWALREHIAITFYDLLMRIDTDLLVLGDLLDTYLVPLMDLFSVFQAFQDWLAQGHNLYLVPGNHDMSKTTSNVSSFEFLSNLLRGHPQVFILDEAGPVPHHEEAYVIPHVLNQDLFDIELEKVPACKYLLVHCNYDNHFAQQSDHSLNMTEKQAQKVPVERIIFAHEHQRRTELAGKVLVIGNQIPTSVADCLGNTEKYYLRLEKDKIVWKSCWTAAGSFQRVDWRETKTADPLAEFIRVEGDADGIEATSVITAISKLRSSHSAFVITNAVKIAGRSMEDITRNHEPGKATFSVLDALMKRLNPKQQEVVKKLMEEHNVQAG